MSAQKFQCPSCGASLDYENTRALTMRCPYCNSSVIVPESLRVASGTEGIGGMESVLGDVHTAQLAEVARLVRSGKKIEAIKLFRETFQTGLKESKDVVDQMEAGQAVDLSAFAITTTPSALVTSLNDDTYTEAELLIRTGKKLDAITLIRRHANMDLAEAKSAVDQIEAAAKEAVGGVTVFMNTPGTTLDAATTAEIQRLTQSGNKIAAIKLMREKTGLGLAEAKNAVEAMEMASKVAGFFGGTMMNATPMTATPTDTTGNLVTVVDGRLTPTVVGNERRAGCSWIFWLVLIGLGIGLFAPLPWSSIGATLELPDNLVPANNQSLWEKYTTDFPTDLGVAIPGGAPAPLLSFGSSGTGQGAFEDPRHIALDGQGNVYVADYGTGRIQRFNEEGEFQSLFRLDAEPTMSMVATRDGDLYIIQSGQVALYDGETGDKLESVSLGGLFSIANNINLAPDGSLLITMIAPDEQVIRLNRRGNNTDRLNINEPFTSLTGQRETMMYVAEDGVGNIYILGRSNNTILQYNQSAFFLNQFGAAEMASVTANGLAIDSKGRLYVAHFWGVLVFDGDGRRVAELKIEGVPHSVAIGENDTVWVVTSNSQVLQYPAVERE